MKPDYNNGDWWGWNGGECPVHPKSKGEFVFADGSICSRKPAGEWDWIDKELPLIAFRVTKEHKEPREFWVVAKAAGMSPEVWLERPSCQNWYGEEIIHVREVTE